jgi:hypothetical protein
VTVTMDIDKRTSLPAGSATVDLVPESAESKGSGEEEQTLRGQGGSILPWR